MLEVSVSKFIDLDLARILNQTNHDIATGNQNIIEHLTVSTEGYVVAVTTLKEEVAYLRAQIDKLTDALAGKG